MNSKYILTAICIITCFSLLAGRKLSSLDDFRDVEIMTISEQGIHITHRSGACVVTENGLSENGRILLKKELDELRQLQEQQRLRQEEHTLKVKLAIQNSQTVDNLELALKILQKAENEFKQASNRDQLLQEIEQKKEKISEFQKEKLNNVITLFDQKNYTDALEILQPIAQQGNAHAQFLLGVFYEHGYAVDKDEKIAFQWYYKSASQRFPQAQHNLAVMYSDGKFVKKNEREAFNWLWKAANQGFSISQLGLATAYANGKGVKKDFAKAMEWGKKAADQNLSSAQLFLGKLYSSVEGGGKYAEAVKCYQEAIKQGNSEAMIALAMCYRSGVGVPQSEKIARQWYQEAISSGNEESRKTAQSHLRYMDEKKKETNTLHAAAAKGDARAQKYLANHYYNNDQISIAVQWYERAGHGGDVEAQYLAGRCYQEGSGIPRNTAKARYWYSKAAANGDQDAIRALKYLQ